MCARHLTQTADLVAAKHLLEALDGGPIESVGEPEVEVDTSDIPEASGVKEKR